MCVWRESKIENERKRTKILPNIDDDDDDDDDSDDDDDKREKRNAYMIFLSFFSLAFDCL